MVKPSLGEIVKIDIGEIYLPPPGAKKALSTVDNKLCFVADSPPDESTVDWKEIILLEEGQKIIFCAGRIGVTSTI